jgi:hypothetical protein
MVVLFALSVLQVITYFWLSHSAKHSDPPKPHSGYLYTAMLWVVIAAIAAIELMSGVDS